MKSLGWVFLCFFSIFSNAPLLFGGVLNIDGVRVRKDFKCLKEVREKHIVKQSLDYSCGPAGLATLLNFYMHDSVGEKQIIQSLLKSVDIVKVQERHGFSLLDLKKFAEERGYSAIGYKMDIDFLRDLDAPVLVPIKFKNFRHFVVIKAVVGDRVYFADPAIGNMSMKINRFIAIWQGGIGLVIEEKERSRDPFASPWHRLKVRIGDTSTVPAYRDVTSSALMSSIRTMVYPTEW